MNLRVKVWLFIRLYPSNEQKMELYKKIQKKMKIIRRTEAYIEVIHK